MKRLFALCLISLFLLCGCADTEMSSDLGIIPLDMPEAEAPVIDAKNNVFGVAFSKSESADPYTSQNKLNAELMGLIAEPLFSVSESFVTSPVLCSGYDVNGRTWTFTIKSGVTFSDGSVLSASDVKYSILSAMEPNSYYATRLSIIESVAQNSREGTVTVVLRYENSRFSALLDFPIIKENTRQNMLPTGTGIYAPNKELTALSARKNHHSGKTPPYAEISLYDVNSSDELLFKFNSLDVSTLSTDPTGINILTPEVRVDLIRVTTTNLHYIGFNTKKPSLANKSVRQAIARAIDRKSIAESDFALMGNAAALPVHPKSSGYSEELASALEYAPEEQITVIEPLTILVNSESSAKISACNRIAESLTRSGAPTTVRALPFEEYTQALRNGDFTLYYAEVALGADFDITRLVSGSLNFGRFYDLAFSSSLSAYLQKDEGRLPFFDSFCDAVPFAPVLFKDTAMYTQKNFFEKTSPSSQNIYHGFCDWVIGE